MLDIAPSEFLLVALVALVVIGPKDLPKAMRVVGYWVGKARGVARQFRQGFDTMVREAELEEMEKKWKEENERIMREHPAEPAAMEPALPAPEPVPDTAASQDSAHDDRAPDLVARPAITDAQPPSAQPSARGTPGDRSAA